jgi:hypothetical protein
MTESDGPGRSIGPRLALAAAAAVLALLVAEAGYSLVTGHSLLHGEPSPQHVLAPAQQGPPTDAEKHAAPDAGGPVSVLSGMYRIDDDPRVRYTLKADSEVSILTSTAHTDHNGLRVRPGPPPPEDALRIDVLGDSVAFGYGVADDETMAARLERLLTDSRGPGARPVACFSVAVPSWNHRMELAFLTDHWDEAHADVVVYVPIANDLGDAGAVWESGKLRLDPDPAQQDPWLLVDRSLLASVERTHGVNGQLLADDVAGPCALEADLTPESSRRYDEMASSIAALQQMLAAHGSKLLMVQSEQTSFAWNLVSRLQRAAPELPVMFVDRYLPDGFQLPTDPHPNAQTQAVRAIWVAQELLTRGLVDAGAGQPLPEVPPAYAELRHTDYDAASIQRFAEVGRERARKALFDEIDFGSGRGIRQVIGGLNADGTLRMHGAFVIRADGPQVQLELAALAACPELYPLAVDVELAGQPAGTLTIEAGQVCKAALELPSSVSPGTPIDVRLLPRTWCVIRVRGVSQVVACRPLRIASPAR